MEARLAGQRILLVGAYERDNFGDRLFLELTRHFLSSTSATVRAGAPLNADCRADYGEFFAAIPTLVRTEPWDVVWTVGGEVGGVDIEGAYRFSLPPEDFETYRASDHQTRAVLRAVLSGSDDIGPAYLPDLASMHHQGAPRLVANSIGIGGLEQLHEPARRRVLSVLASAHALSVREGASASLLAAHDIDAAHAPDLVHSLSGVHPIVRDGSGREVVFQANIPWLAAHTEEAAVHLGQLAGHGRRIVLLPAGVAPGHDSVESLEVLATAIARRNPEADIELVHARNPLGLAQRIGRAAVFIGTSLHGRIVSSSYGVPRVALENRKVSAYAGSWDPVFPVDTTATDLSDAVASALALGTASEEQDRSRELASAATDNVITMIEGLEDA